MHSRSVPDLPPLLEHVEIGFTLSTRRADRATDRAPLGEAKGRPERRRQVEVGTLEDWNGFGDQLPMVAHRAILGSAPATCGPDDGQQQDYLDDAAEQVVDPRLAHHRADDREDVDDRNDEVGAAVGTPGEQ